LRLAGQDLRRIAAEKQVILGGLLLATLDTQIKASR
jgi:hypothetical protein